jgi:mercuric ion transport protein
MSKTWAGLALLGSTATLLCCVIPALLVALGFGASVAGVFAALPQLSLVSDHKGAIFTAAGALIALAFWARSRPEAQVCPTDPALAKACIRTRRFSAALLWFATLLYSGALFFVYALPHLL